MPTRGSLPTAASPRWELRIGVVALLTALTILAWPKIAARQQAWMAARLAERAQGAGDDAARATVRRLERMGLPALEPLVRLAASQRLDLASAAQGAVEHQLTAWEIAAKEGGDLEVYAQQLLELSSAIERYAPQLDGAGWRWAQQLSRRMAADADKLATNEAWNILVRCERALAAPTLESPTKLAVGEPIVLERMNAAAVKPLLAPKVVEPPAAIVAAPLPKKEVVKPRIELWLVETSPPPPKTAKRFPEMTGNLLRPPMRPLTPEEQAAADRSSAQVVAPLPMGPVVDVPSPQEARQSVRRLRDLSDRELMARVDQSERYESSAVRQVLRERGYSDAILEMTRSLEQLPPGERREALDRASLLPAADARQLLRWCVLDADADVRLQALTILATTGDPKLAAIVRERAVEDADPRVAELAAKLMQR